LSAVRARIRAFVVAAAVVLAACGGDSPPDALREGRNIYGNVCSVCHGSSGGGGVGPSLTDVARTWPSCTDHTEWIRLGSDGWKAIFGDTYGATDKPVEGGMPPHDQTLTADQRRKVAAFERFAYGGLPREEALAGCGITDPAEADPADTG
jgi:mono/diheme cytochrome c family protein